MKPTTRINGGESTAAKKKVTVKSVLISVICVCVFFTLCLFAGRSVLKSLYPLRYNEFVESYAQEYNIDKNLLYAVIETESGFNPEAVSSAGALGLTQILPDTFTWLQGKTGEKLETAALHDPETSIKYGALFYGLLMERYGSVETAAAAYHAGMGNVRKWLNDKTYSADGETLDSIPFASTANYVHKIVRAMTIYEKLY